MFCSASSSKRTSASALTLVARCLASTLVALALVACGSSDEGSDGSSKSGSSPKSDRLSKTDLIARADKICRDAAERIRALPKPTSLADVEQVSDGSARASDEAVGRLEALKAPESVQADYAAFVKRAGRAAEQAHDVADAAKTNDINKVIAATGNIAGDAEARRLARKIGFKVCHGGPGSLLPPGASPPAVPNRPASP